jgi:hypothetical protein
MPRRFRGAMVGLACARPTIDDADSCSTLALLRSTAVARMATFLSRQPVSPAQPTGQHEVITAHPPWTEHSMMLEPSVFAAVITHPSRPLHDPGGSKLAPGSRRALRKRFAR